MDHGFACDGHAESFRYGPVGRIRLVGEVDCAFAQDLARTLEAMLNEAPLDRIVVDLRGATFIDSTILGVLVATWKRARRLRIRLVFVKGPPAVHRPFEKTHIADHLTFVEV